MHATEIGFLHRGVGLDFLRRAGDQHAALLQHGHALDQLEQRIHVVVDDDHGAAARDRLEQLDGLDPFARAHAGERLVEQQQTRGSRERESDLQSALLAIGEFRHGCVGAAGQIDQSERVLHLLGQALDAGKRTKQVEPEFSAQLGESRDRQVLPHRQASEELVDLIALGEAELADFRDLQARDVAPLEHDLARGRRNLAGQHLEEGRFAGAVGADDAAQLPLIDAEVDVAVGGEPAIALGEAGGFQDRAGIGGMLDLLDLHRCRRNILCSLDLCFLGRLGILPALAGHEAVEIDQPADDAATEEADQQDEHDTEHELPGCSQPQRGLQEVLQKQPDCCADQRPE